MGRAKKQAVAAAAVVKRSAGAGMAGAVLLCTPSIPPVEAKAPGVTHCYRNVCHRVRTVEQTRRLVGRTMVIETSFYDMPGADRFNAGVFTSNGERFNAGDPARVASADLPDGTELLIRNPINGRVSHVRVNDFGPFRGDRRLDVTRRVAEDLDFKHKGVVKLEVTVIAPPHEEDLQYRRNRPPRATTGHLGVVFDAEVPELVVKLVAERTPGNGQSVAVAAAEADLGAGEFVGSGTGLPPSGDAGGSFGLSIATYEQVLAIAAGPVTSSEFESSGQDVSTRLAEEIVLATAERMSEQEVFPVRQQAEFVSLPERSVTGSSVAIPLEEDAPVQVAKAPIDEPPERTVWGQGLLQSGVTAVSGDAPPMMTTAATAAAGFAGAVSFVGSAASPFLPLSQQWLIFLIVMLASALLIYTAAFSRGSGVRASVAARPNVTPPSPTPNPTSTGRRRIDMSVLARDAGPAIVPSAPATVAAVRSAESVTAKPDVADASPKLTVSVIGSEMKIDGTVKTSGKLIVSGIIRGRVEAGELVLLRGGSIEGEIVARCVEIAGEYRGNAVAEKVSIAAGGHCEGEVTASAISVDFGAFVEATFKRPSA